MKQGVDRILCALKNMVMDDREDIREVVAVLHNVTEWRWDK